MYTILDLKAQSISVNIRTLRAIKKNSRQKKEVMYGKCLTIP